MSITDIFYLTYLALLNSAFVKIIFMIILYAIAYELRAPKKNWYNYEDSQISFFQKREQNPTSTTLFLDNTSRKSN
jgi:hypothetical protein